MKQFTDVTFLVDRSGSMASIKTDMEKAFDTFLKEHRSNPSTRITLIQFDDKNRHSVQYQNVPISAAESLNLRPRGNTPLLDAFVQAIDSTGSRLADMDEADRPDQVLFVVITDGQENASTIYKRQDVSNRVTKQNGTYKWQFVYLGANQDSFHEAASMGIKYDWAINYAGTSKGIGGMASSLTSNTVAFANQRNRGASLASYSIDQRKEAADGDASLINPTNTSGTI